MKIVNNKAEGVKIAYIGGGSRGWAWTLMADLILEPDMSGDVYLYDIDYEAAKANEIIGNKTGSNWKYVAVKTIGEALTGADAVIVSILPGTFDEMQSDVHAPEKYGVYQSVGDTTSVGGVIRAMRTIPMMRDIALAVKEYCPEAWVINYTNPMTMCVKALYKAFPEIKAFGCCHEVFGTQRLLVAMLEDMCGIKGAKQQDMQVEVTGVNHFTWFTKARYQNIDLMPIFKEFSEKYAATGFDKAGDKGWMNSHFTSADKVKMDLYRRYGYIAAAGDRHLAEFMDADEYLKDPETVANWCFSITPVEWRKKDLLDRLERSRKLASGEEEFPVKPSGEEGVAQIKALIGLSTLVTNVNIPNVGQIPNLPMGSVVETNAVFRSDSLSPVYAGEIPDKIYPLIKRISDEMDETVDACFSYSLDECYKVFAKNHALKNVSDADKKKLFDEMVANTAKYLGEYK